MAGPIWQMCASPELAGFPEAAVLNRFVAAAQSNSHILAAVLHGSHARGAADPWSDIDLGLVVADDGYDDFLAGREMFVRQLGEPLFLEDFDIPGMMFFILADGTEGEISINCESDFIEPHGTWCALLDKNETLSKVRPRSQPDPSEQAERLRRQITWFWHDLSHFITAMGRGQLWWAAGQLEILRRVCVILARLQHDFSDLDAADDPYFKIDKAVAAVELAPLATTYAPLERAAMLTAAQKIVSYFRQAARPLSVANGISYSDALEQLMLERLSLLTDGD